MEDQVSLPNHEHERFVLCMYQSLGASDQETSLECQRTMVCPQGLLLSFIAIELEKHKGIWHCCNFNCAFENSTFVGSTGESNRYLGGSPKTVQSDIDFLILCLLCNFFPHLSKHTATSSFEGLSSGPFNILLFCHQKFLPVLILSSRLCH